MDKIYITIISILVIIIISLSIYILIKSGIYKNMITDLKEENKQLQTQISSAEALIDFQNTKIDSYAVNIKMAEEGIQKILDQKAEKLNKKQAKINMKNAAEQKQNLEKKLLNDSIQNLIDNSSNK